MIKKNFQVCTRCVMDTTDPEIYFTSEGVCNHCLHFDEVTAKRWFPCEEGKEKLSRIFERVKREGKNSEYDCIIGLSGGLDSSYLAVILKDYGLRPLVVHVDAGWNSELAVHNIEQVVKYCNYDLHTHVMEWQEVKDLQLAYMKAGVANQDVVQDHAFFTSLYDFAVKNKIKYVISGGNIATESVFPRAWHHDAMDGINLAAIHKKYGNGKLNNYKLISFFDYYFYYPFVKGMTVVRPLNYMPFNKDLALSFLKEAVGYKEYGGKHGESRFTRFFQNYYLPTKFDMDKRKPHLSSQILSGALSRDEALSELQKPLYDDAELVEDKAYIAKKLGLTVGELENLVSSEGHSYTDYPNWDSRYHLMKKIQLFVHRFLGRDIKTYS